MNLLISNNDGINTHGIIALEKELSQVVITRVSAFDREHWLKGMK